MDARKLMSWVGRVKRFQWRLVGLIATFLKHSAGSFEMKRRMQILDLMHVTPPFSQAHACKNTQTHSEDNIYMYIQPHKAMCSKNFSLTVTMLFAAYFLLAMMIKRLIPVYVTNTALKSSSIKF
jgi:hypothetical protein